MKLSARNLLKGTIVEVKKGQTTAHVRIDFAGTVVTASITNEAVDELKLQRVSKPMPLSRRRMSWSQSIKKPTQPSECRRGGHEGSNAGRAGTASSAKVASELLSVEEAWSRIVAAMPVLGAEKVRVGSAAGRALAEDVVAIVSLPPVPVSAMDGYACRSADVKSLPATLQKIGTSRAGSHFAGSVTAGTCVRIFTGAVVPAGADVIALQEDAAEQDGAVTIKQAAKAGQFIRLAGMDFKAGQRCFARDRAFAPESDRGDVVEVMRFRDCGGY